MNCIIKFSTEWCGPCKMYKKTYEELKEKYPSVTFLTVNPEQDKASAEKYGIRTVPQFVVLKNSEIVEKWSGINHERMQKSIHLLLN